MLCISLAKPFFAGSLPQSTLSNSWLIVTLIPFPYCKTSTEHGQPGSTRGGATGLSVGEHETYFVCFESLHLNVLEILMSADKLALLKIDKINSESIQVSADKVGKKNQFDLVELAAQVQLASATSYFASLHDHCYSA